MKNIILIIAFVLIIISILSLYIFRTDIYRVIVPNVEITEIGPMFINGKKYEMTVLNDFIHKNDEGMSYVFLAKTHASFWYLSNYCYIAQIKIIEQDNTHSAIIFPDADYQNNDKIIIKYSYSLIHGKDIFICE